MTAFRFKPWHDFVAFLLLAALLIVGVCFCSGCWARGMSPEDAAKAGGAVGSLFGPYGTLIGAGVAYVTAFAARKIERDRMLARHQEMVQGLTQTISALKATAATIPAAKYAPNDQNPLNGDGLVPHG